MRAAKIVTVAETAPPPTEFNEAYFRRMSELEDRHVWTAAMRTLTFALLKREAVHPPRRLLDAGCGTGLFLSQWQSQHPGAVITGVDFSLDALRLAARRAPGHWIAASAAALPFRRDSFDAIHCADVLQHLSLRETDQALDLFAGLLRPNGLLAVRVRSRRIFRNTPDVDYSHAFTRARLRREFQKRGMRTLFLAHVNSLLSLWAELRSFNGWEAGTAVKGIHCRPVGDTRGIWAASYLRLERAWLLRFGRGLPFGNTLVAIAQKPTSAASGAL